MIYDKALNIELLVERDKEFIEFRESIPDSHWARIDISAVRVGWEARKINDKQRIAELEKGLESAIDDIQKLACYAGGTNPEGEVKEYRQLLNKGK